MWRFARIPSRTPVPLHSLRSIRNDGNIGRSIRTLGSNSLNQERRYHAFSWVAGFSSTRPACNQCTSAKFIHKTKRAQEAHPEIEEEDAQAKVPLHLVHPIPATALGHPQLTMLKSFHTGSLGCAPTPSQYFARDRSRAISLYERALAFSSYRLVGRFGIGLKVPMTSRGFAPRADLVSESQLEAIL